MASRARIEDQKEANSENNCPFACLMISIFTVNILVLQTTSFYNQKIINISNVFGNSKTGRGKTSTAIL